MKCGFFNLNFLGENGKLLRRDTWARCPFQTYRFPLPSGLFWKVRTSMYFVIISLSGVEIK